MYSPYFYQTYKPSRPTNQYDYYRSLSQDNYRTIDNYGSLPRNKHRSITSDNFGSLPRDKYRSPTSDNFGSLPRDKYRSSRDNLRSITRDNYRSRSEYRSPSLDNYDFSTYRAASRIPVRNASTNWIAMRKRVSYLTWHIY